MAYDKYKATYLIVVGSGTFPLDMLRYESCHPLEEVDSGVIGRSRNSNCTSIVVLRRFSADGGASATGPARWKSFGWRLEAYSNDKDKIIEEARRLRGEG